MKRKKFRFKTIDGDPSEICCDIRFGEALGNYSLHVYSNVFTCEQDWVWQLSRNDNLIKEGHQTTKVKARVDVVAAFLQHMVDISMTSGKVLHEYEF